MAGRKQKPLPKRQLVSQHVINNTVISGPPDEAGVRKQLFNTAEHNTPVKRLEYDNGDIEFFRFDNDELIVKLNLFDPGWNRQMEDTGS